MAAARWHAVLPLDLTVRSRVLVGPLHVGRRHRPRLASESVPVLTIAVAGQRRPGQRNVPGT